MNVIPVLFTVLAMGPVAPPAVVDPGSSPQATGVETTLYLVGDAGEPDPRFEPVLEALAADIAANEAAAIVAFLGDNIYPAGLPPADDPGYREAVRRLSAQVRAVTGAGARAILLPGNHDWNDSGGGGLDRVRAQGRLIATLGGDRARMLPEDGCPGPAVVDVGSRLRLIAIDTEWWLQEPEARGAGTGCPTRTEPEVLAGIETALADTDGRHSVVLAHHPLRSGGPHGGYFTWDQHLFPLRELADWAWLPLPLVGSLYPLVRGSGVSDQDLASEGNARMREALETAMRTAPPLVYASGHEHSLHVLRGESARWLVVSGGGIYGHTTPVRALDETLFVAEESGYVRLDVRPDGRVRLAVIAVDERGGRHEMFTLALDPAA